jgi:hypothetical protein
MLLSGVARIGGNLFILQFLLKLLAYLYFRCQRPKIEELFE